MVDLEGSQWTHLIFHIMNPSMGSLNVTLPFNVVEFGAASNLLSSQERYS